MNKRNYIVIAVAIFVIIFDQISKYAVTVNIQLHQNISVITGFFNLVHVRNRGMAFGLLNRQDSILSVYILIAAGLIAIGLLFFWFFKLNENADRFIFPFSLILGGAIGNLIDRIRLGEVIDFIDLHIRSYHWPAFNIADSAITVGTIWAAFYLLFPRQVKDNEKIT